MKVKWNWTTPERQIEVEKKGEKPLNLNRVLKENEKKEQRNGEKIK